jgi:hypothetical protein
MELRAPFGFAQGPAQRMEEGRKPRRGWIFVEKQVPMIPALLMKILTFVVRFNMKELWET